MVVRQSVKPINYSAHWYRPGVEFPYSEPLGAFWNDVDARNAFDTWRKDVDPHHAREMWLEDSSGRKVTNG